MTESTTNGYAVVSETQAAPESILAEADRLVNGDRLETYEGTDDTIVALWSAYLGVDLTVLDYANLMVLLKVARTKGKFHRDSYVDIAGYAEVGPRLWQAKQEPEWGTAEPLPGDTRLWVLPEEPTESWYVTHRVVDGQRQWYYLNDEIPEGVVVEDDRGDRWARAGSDEHFTCITNPAKQGSDEHRGTWFTEVVPRQWEQIESVPDRIPVLDVDGDPFHWEGGKLMYAGAPWGTVSSSFNRDLGPFTEVLDQVRPLG